MEKIIPPKLPTPPVRPETIPRTHVSFLNAAPEDLLTIGMWMNMRNEGEVGAVASFQKASHSRNQSKHNAWRRRVEEANDDEEDSGSEAQEVDEHLFDPERVRLAVEKVREDAAKGP